LLNDAKSCSRPKMFAVVVQLETTAQVDCRILL
jgi:hypothetical protein